MSQCDMLRIGGLPYELHQTLWGRLRQINLNLRPAVPRTAGNETRVTTTDSDYGYPYKHTCVPNMQYDTPKPALLCPLCVNRLFTPDDTPEFRHTITVSDVLLFISDSIIHTV